MAKANLAKKEETALAPAEEVGALAQALDGLDIGTDGLEEIEGRDIQIAALVANMKGVDRAGDPIPPNVWYNTVTETSKKKAKLALLVLHKTHEWREFDQAESRSKIHCRSMDRVTGTMENGSTRKCEGCPDYQWQQIDGKRTRRCGDVWNVAAVDRETEEPVVIRFKKTSLGPIKTYLNRHFIGRLVQGSKRGNVPLFAIETVATLKMSDDGKYAVPVLEPGDVLPREEILRHQESSKTYREVFLPMLSKLAERDTDEEGGSSSGPDTSFSPNEFMDTTGTSSAASAAANPNLF